MERWILYNDELFWNVFFAVHGDGNGLKSDQRVKASER